MRIYINADEMIEETKRDLAEMGIVVRPATMQDKYVKGNPDYETPTACWTPSPRTSLGSSSPGLMLSSKRESLTPSSLFGLRRVRRWATRMVPASSTLARPGS